MRGKKGSSTTRSRPAKVQAASDARSNVTDETITEVTNNCVALYNAMAKKRTELDSAMGEYRASLKKAKDKGIDRDAVTWYIKESRRDIADVEREIQWKNRIARVMGLPIGTQLGLFTENVTVATAVDEAQIQQQVGELKTVDAPAAVVPTGIDLHAAYQEGLTAGKNAKPFSACTHEHGSPAHIKWVQGWEDAQFENASGIQKLETVEVGPQTMGAAH